MRLNLYVESDNVIELLKLRHPTTKAYINDASVTASIREDDDVTVVVDNVELEYNGLELGGYVGSAEAVDTDLTEGDFYWVRIVVVSSEGTTTFRERCKAKYYTGC